jgi:hypothetical protein
LSHVSTAGFLEFGDVDTVAGSIGTELKTKKGIVALTVECSLCCEGRGGKTKRQDIGSGSFGRERIAIVNALHVLYIWWNGSVGEIVDSFIPAGMVGYLYVV